MKTIELPISPIDLDPEGAAERIARRERQRAHLMTLVHSLGDDALLALVLISVAVNDGAPRDAANLHEIAIHEYRTRKGEAALDALLGAVYQ